jgi:hypothetical protein
MGTSGNEVYNILKMMDNVRQNYSEMLPSITLQHSTFTFTAEEIIAVQIPDNVPRAVTNGR